MAYEPIRPSGLPPLPKIRQIAMLVDVENYSQVDLYAQITLRSVPNDPHAHLAVAWVAKRFNYEQKYNYHLDQAKKSERSLEDLSADLHIDFQELMRFVKDELPLKDESSTSYHLIKAWGYGFCSEMSAVLSHCYLAEILERTPVVHWGDNFLYRGTENGCAFKHFFKPFNDLGVADLVKLSDASIYPPKWKVTNLSQENIQKRNGEYGKLSSLYFFNRPETLTVADYYSGVINIKPWLPDNHKLKDLDFDDTYRYLVEKYMSPSQEISDQVNEFVERNLAGGFLAVHARGSDKDEGYRSETSIPSKILSKAKEYLSTVDPSIKIFLMTDDQKLLKKYKEVFADRLVFTDSQRSSSNTGVHYDKNNDRLAAGKEMLLDMLIAAKANYFIGLGLSNPSQLVYYFGDFTKENYTLFGENRLKQFNTHLYQTISVK